MHEEKKILTTTYTGGKITISVCNLVHQGTGRGQSSVTQCWFCRLWSRPWWGLDTPGIWRYPGCRGSARSRSRCTCARTGRAPSPRGSPGRWGSECRSPAPSGPVASQLPPQQVLWSKDKISTISLNALKSRLIQQFWGENEENLWKSEKFQSILGRLGSHSKKTKNCYQKIEKSLNTLHVLYYHLNIILSPSRDNQAGTKL